mgnify:CR=1 FL=1
MSPRKTRRAILLLGLLAVVFSIGLAFASLELPSLVHRVLVDRAPALAGDLLLTLAMERVAGSGPRRLQVALAIAVPLSVVASRALSRFMAAQFNFDLGQARIPAQAVVKGETIVVSAAEVKAPVAVRFAWHETTIGNFGNAEGLPASPFRTDDW